MFLKKISLTCFANDFDTNEIAWNPQVWAQETLAILEENMVIGRLVHTDFSDEIQNFGDTVNTRLPGTFTAERKGTNDDVTIQDASATNVPVKLDQHVHTSFLIRDGEESRSFKDLIKEYLSPAALSLAQHVDKILLGQAYQFLVNATGTLGSFTSTTAKAEILACREKLTSNNCPMEGRNFILTPPTETEVLELDLFISADKIGDDGTAMREASIGRKLGFDFYACQNAPSVTVAAGTGNANELAADASIGDTTLTLDAAVLNNGQYFWLEDDGQPLRVASGGGTTTVVTDRALKADVLAASSDLFEVTEGTVDLAGHTGVTAYPIGYSKRIKVDGTGTPHVGQVVAFATAASAATVSGEYMIIAIPATGYIILDRPLEVAIADNYVVNYGPRGEYNFAFHREALALVSRPLAMPRAGTGALSGVASYNDLSMRVTITYDGTKQGHLVTLDVLAGVKVLNTALGAVMLGGEYTETYT